MPVRRLLTYIQGEVMDNNSQRLDYHSSGDTSADSYNQELVELANTGNVNGIIQSGLSSIDC